ncbi:STAS domain-containing protein [Planosporangium sp. 12N6]|uniref:STAS domain-containing protein n=1 Tax=Planosporangium spinosum TaxID=3402278 RepID=UPI003CE66FC4
MRTIEVQIQENRTRDHLVLTRLDTDHGDVCLAASGEIDICNVDHLRSTIKTIITEPATHRLTLDFADLDYIDSMGVSALIMGRRLGQQHGTGFGVVNLRGDVLRVVQILGLQQALAPAI